MPDARADFVTAIGDQFAAWRLARATGLIYATLLLEPEPVSLNWLADRTGLSAGQVSTSVRELVAWGLADTTPTPGSRRIDVRATAGFERLLAASIERTRSFVATLEGGRALADGPAAERLDDVTALFGSYVRAESRVLEDWRDRQRGR